jgi:hypothetical protein
MLLLIKIKYTIYFIKRNILYSEISDKELFILPILKKIMKFLFLIKIFFMKIGMKIYEKN